MTSLRPLASGGTSRGRLSAAVAAGVLALAGCGSGSSEPPAPADAPSPVGDPGPVHVHGLGENPRDGALFVATHTGLFRVEPDGSRARRVAGRYQDTMGFTVVGPDEFLGSGHPDGRERLPAFLGLIRSTDAGRTWDAVSLQGKADFHVLEASGRRVYGYGTDWDTRAAQLLVSADAGRTWRPREAPEPLASLAIDPRDAERVVAAGEASLHLSSDAGRSWRAVEGPPGLVSWPDGGDLYLGDRSGRAHASSDGGRSWSGRGRVGGEPAAFEATGPEELYAALHDGTVKRSGDGGRSWRVHYAPR
jgi:hypothetical protein